ncbi:MAG: ribonuclease H [Microthrixaceae bacterium]|nr:DUF1273 family protein [Microthrixaceae bacterium]
MAARDLDATVIYTDGACINNPGPGGWAWAIPGGAHASGFDEATTNQRMEVTAAFEAVLANPGRLHIVSDSTYVVDCFNKRWHEGWVARGWLNAQKRPVANQDLWKPFIEEYLNRRDEITFAWVKGHSGDEMNDLVDRLAIEAAQSQCARHGDEPPTDLGEPDGAAGSAPGSTDARADSSPASKLGPWVVAVFGHRPPELGGYDETNPTAVTVTARLREVIEALAVVHPDLVVASGLGLGAEQYGAQAAVDSGVDLVAVLAYPAPDKVWPRASRERFAALAAAATRVITLSPTAPATKQAAGQACGARDRWLTEACDAAIVVWDAKDRNLGRIVSDLEAAEVSCYLITPPTP